MTFKVGDRVKVVRQILGLKFGSIYTITSISDCGNFYRVNGKTSGNPESYFKLVEEKQMKFKVGDKVRITGNTNGSRNEVGDIGFVTHCSGDDSTYRVEVDGRKKGIYCQDCWTEENEMELVEVIEYENEWHLNDGKVTIPADADKLEKDGSVVAFRKRKITFKFGDKVKSTSTGNIYLVVSGVPNDLGWITGIGEEHRCVTTLNTENITKVL